MTNRHVIEGADKVKIVFKDGREFDGEVLGVDRESDIGVVKIDATGLTRPSWVIRRRPRPANLPSRSARRSS